ncbi:MAG TPA: aminotransferase class IV, partial [Sedimentisphaerales bacterium]|nr:aminotransferase class IV [Sedimentisphaerales bacterium]
MAEKAFLNGKIVDVSSAGISVRDVGFLYGAGLFETMRCCGGVVFAIDDHLDRLFASAEKLGVRNTYSREAVRAAIYAAVRANGFKDARVRLTLTGGETHGEQSTLLVMATPYEGYPEEYYQKGIRTVLCNMRQNTEEITCGHKTLSYFARMAALNQAKLKGAAEALWLTVDGRLAEGSISNLFLVKGGTVATPPLT